jgi:hypothetical protein
MGRKVVNFCHFTKSWIVWDRARREVIGYYATKHEANNAAVQLELF